MQDQQIKENMVERTREIELFQEWFTDQDGESVLYIYDALPEEKMKGGVGKTWLLDEFALIAEQLQPSLIVVRYDFFTIADRDGAQIATCIAQALRKKYRQWTPSRFDHALKAFTENIESGKSGDITSLFNKLFEGLTSDLRELERQLPEINTYLLLLFDTFEMIEQNPKVAVLQPASQFPELYGSKRIRAVVAGRNQPGVSAPIWIEKEQRVRLQGVMPFSLQEMRSYFNQAGLQLNEQEERLLYEKTEQGRPILVALVADTPPWISTKQLLTQFDFKRYLVQAICGITDPLEGKSRIFTLYMAHIYHRFNVRIMRWLQSDPATKEATQDIVVEDLEETLLAKPYVRHAGTGDDFVLHDEMRGLVREYCLEGVGLSKQSMLDLSHAIIRYYEHEIKKAESRLVEQAYTVEMLYHQLFVDPNEGFIIFDRAILSALELWNSPHARALLQEAKQFEHSLSAEHRWTMQLREARLLRIEEQLDKAIELLQQLKSTKGAWHRAHLGDILYEIGYCYLEKSFLKEAKVCFEEGRNVFDQQGNEGMQADLLDSLGFIYLRQGQLDEALKYYYLSRDIHKKLKEVPEFTNTINNIANVYRLQGRIDEAITLALDSLEKRRKLIAEEKGSRIVLGRVLNTLGTIYLDTDRLIEAEKKFQEARDIYEDAGSKKGRAICYNRLGQVAMAREDLKTALDWFSRAEQFARTADKESLINSLNKQGRIYKRQKRWEKALKVFEEALSEAINMPDHYQHAENLIDMADVLVQLAREEDAQRCLEEAHSISSEYNYYFLLGREMEVRGDITYTHDAHISRFIPQGFRFYVQACDYMAHYNNLKFTTICEKIRERLLQLLPHDIFQATDLMLQYWSDHDLVGKYPLLVMVCTDIRSNIIE